jgi:hypothetical protein
MAQGEERHGSDPEKRFILLKNVLCPADAFIQLPLLFRNTEVKRICKQKV